MGTKNDKFKVTSAFCIGIIVIIIHNTSSCMAFLKREWFISNKTY